MKRLGMIVMAGLLLLGLAQCKKEQTPASTGTEGVRITLNVGPSAGSGTNGSRVVVDPTGNGGEFNYATVNYENGDIIYVGYNGACVGSLTCQHNTFSGEVNITETVAGEHLHFYLLGGKGFTPQFDGNTATVNISEQATNYPVISYAPSKEAYNGAGSYTAKLMNKCSIMKFNVTTPSTAAICITGMNNTVTVDFSKATNDNEDNGFSYSKDGDGLITMPGVTAENTTTWAIVLPQNALAEGAAGSLYTADNAYIGTRPEMAAIEMNKFLDAGLDLTVNTAAVPEGAINGKFTINGDGDQVYFSKGNLQYQASTSTWQFATNQYDYIGGANSRISQDYSGWIDLFGWGTSGYNHGAIAYQPWSTSKTNSEYYAYGSDAYNLYDQTGQADWGYNAISNGGNQVNSGWRTLTSDEWAYVFNSRTTSSGIRYAKAKVNNVNGVILLPDNWTTSTYTLSNTNSSGANFTSNTITAENWANTLEANGAVFLPAAGDRSGTSVRNPGSNGYYWSSTNRNGNIAYSLVFSSNFVSPQDDGFRIFGRSVRLACPAE